MASSDFLVVRPSTLRDTGAFSRASVGTYFDYQGVMRTAAAAVPRFDHDPVTLALKGLLLEAAASNLIFPSTNWSVGAGGGLTRTANYGVASDGTTSTMRLQWSGSANSYLYPAGVAVAAGTYTGSLYVKPVAGKIGIALGAADASAISTVEIDTTGALSAPTASGANAANISGLSATATSIGGGVYRVALTATHSASLANMIVGAVAITNAAGEAQVWGLQLEAGSVATSYIATTIAAATRAAEANTTQVLSSIPELATGDSPDPAQWAAATAYLVGDRVSRTAGVNSAPSGLHSIYQRVIAGTTATAPESDATNWIRVGPTNRWRMFDASNDTQSSATGEIVVALTPGVLCDTIAFDNLDVDSVRVIVPGTSYDKTLQMRTRDCATWFQYFFEPFTLKTSAVFTGLPMNAAQTVIAVFTKRNGVAYAGTAVIGMSKTVGGAQYGATIGIVDYSVKSTDAFGNTTVVQRPYSKRLRVDISLTKGKVDDLQRFFAVNRTVPLLFVGAGNTFSALILYGYYRSFDIVIEGPSYSRCALEVEGLTAS